MKYSLIILLFIVTLKVGAQVPKKTFAESLSASETVNDTKQDAVSNSGGDLNISVPLVTVKSKTMSFPIALSYTSGITVGKQSGPVGLGWVLPFGNIVRDFGAYEPDYTATNSEINMANNSGGTYDGRIQPNINPYYYNKDLVYELESDMGEDGYTIPDEYHVSAPGFFSNTFFNASDNSVTPYQWKFQESVPYQVDFEVKNFEIAQEFSRINEANLLTTNMDNLTDKSEFDRQGSYAAAIGLLPFVHNGFVEIPDNGGDFNPRGDDKLVRYDDFKSFTITDDNGVQFVFGRPLRGQKYIISEDPYWSTVNLNGAGYSVGSEGNFWKTDFIAEWLLTEIRSPDYVDANNNHKADDGDLGDWIRIEYTDPQKKEGYNLLASSISASNEKVPSYREWSNFSQTDRASSLMFEKAYVTKIITPTQTIDFTISQRHEVDHDYYSKPANRVGHEWFYEDRQFVSTVNGGSAVDFDILYPVETMKYDQITIKDNSKDYDVYLGENPVTGIIKLNYAAKGSGDELAVSNYLIRDENNADRAIDEPSEGNTVDIGDYYTLKGRGKTTLLGVTFYDGNETEADKKEYEFEYGNNPSYSEIHKREIVRKRLFPSIRQSNWEGTALHEIALNHIDYYTQADSLLGTIPVEPTEFLIDCPYEEVYEKVIGLTNDNKRMYYIHNESLPAGAAINETTIHHQLHPVKDILNYAILPDGTENKAAWSLTKITYPTGASIAFEYEPDQFELTEDELAWNVKSDALPLVKEYNELARRRSKVQDAANQINQGKYDKTLNAALSTELTHHSGGIRLKKKTIHDGIHDPIEVNYSYGDGHYTALPPAFVQNTYACFNSFISRERKRHKWERLYYQSVWPVFLPEWHSDFNNKMSMFTFTTVAIDKVRGEHFYESIEEVYENGASSKKTYGNLDITNGVFYETHRLLKSRDDLATHKPKFVYTSDFSVYSGIDLLKVEQFEAGHTEPYETQTFKYGIEDVIDYRLMMTDNFPADEPLYDNTFEIWLCITGVDGYNIDPHYYHNSVFTGIYNSYKLGEGATEIIDLSEGAIDGFSWANVQGTALGAAFVNIKPPVGHEFEYGFNYLAETANKWGSRKKILLEEKNKVRGQENITSYEYETTYRYPKKITQSLTGGHSAITINEYGFETYDGLTDLFENSNILKPIARSTTYYNTVDNDKVLSASFTEWEFTGTYPRIQSQYQYKTDLINHTTGEFTLVPFSIAGSNPEEWHQLEHAPLKYDMDGLLSLQRKNQVYEKTIVGYNRSEVKATITSVDGEFDATYTGFEDLPALTNVDIGTLPYPEYWYYQDIILTPQDIPVNLHTEANGFNECGNEIYFEDTDSYKYFLSIKIVDNEDVDGPLFQIGDLVTLNGTYTGGTFPALTTTIVDIVELTGTAVKFCFSSPLPDDYITHWEDAPHVLTLSKQKTSKETGISGAYRRTGRYVYKLHSKMTGGAASRKTPVRPIIPISNSLVSYPLICHTAPPDHTEGIIGDGYYPESCYTLYEASVWVKHDYDIPRIAADNAGELPVLEPYGTGGTGGFVTYGSTLTSDDFNNTYLRGTVSETMTGKNVKLVYKLWSADRTVLVDEGIFYLNDLNKQWKQYTIEIPLFQGAVGKQLDVYVENDLIDDNDIHTHKSVFVDDLIIYPKGAVYQYMSVDKFKQTTHITNNNDVFQTQQSDKWGRTKRLWNGYGDETNAYSYQQWNSLTTDNSITETIWTGHNTYFKTRTYTNGFGETKQTIVSDPVTNKRTVLSTTDFNSMGWPEKTYKSYSLNSAHFSFKHNASYAVKVQELYGSNNAFEVAEYDATLEQFPNTIKKARTDSESDIFSTMSRYNNAVAKGGAYGIPTYAIGELLVTELISPEGEKSKIYTDEQGRTVLNEVEVGYTYVDNADGSISFSATEMPILQTWSQYDALGRLIKTVDPDGKISEYKYNSIGQQIEVTMPDRGTTKMKYDTYGQLRFSQSAKDLSVITNPDIIDQFKYLKYDRWGRIITAGVMREMSANPLTNGLGETYSPAVLFTNATHIENQSYPENGIMFNQVNQQTNYDGTRATYDAHALLEKIVYSNHSLNADHQFIPEETDKENITYLLDGNIKSKAYLYHEFTQPHVFTYQYSRYGLPTKKEYQHPSDPTQNYKWTYKYDNFGRPTELYSGNNTEFKLNGKNYYDALGNRYKIGLGSTIDPLDPHIDYIVYKQNIRDELVSQMSANFRLGLTYNKNGMITDQYWSSEEHDPTTGTPVNVNRYHYYYDKNQRLIGADYLTQSFAVNPFAYFDELAPQEFNEFNCTMNYADAAPQVHQLADVINNGGNGISDVKKERAVQSLFYVRDEYLNSGLSWNNLSQNEQDAFLTDIIEKSASKQIDLKAYEEVLATIHNDQAHLGQLQSNTFQSNAQWSISGQVNIGEVNTYGFIDAGSMKYTKIALSTLVKWSLMNCETNYGATIYGFLPDFDKSGTETNATIYDAAYWYYPNGNTSLLHRKNQNVGDPQHTQTYHYSPSNNWLTSVDWYDGTASTTTFTYDDLGNVTYDEENNNTLAYNYFTDLPISLTNLSGVKKYRYDTDGIRTIKNIDGNKEFYLDGIVLADDESVKSYQTETGYATPVVDGSLDFHHHVQDWLGTNRTVVNETGDVTSARDHYPYGKLMPDRATETDVEGKRYQFTGHEFDDEVNYGYHGARYYNRELGRYLSVDPLAAKYRSLSPYVYVADNPIMLIDPDGRDIIPTNSEAHQKFNSYVDSYTYTDKKGNTITGAELFGVVEHGQGYRSNLGYSLKKFEKRLKKAGITDPTVKDAAMGTYIALNSDLYFEVVSISEGMTDEDLPNQTVEDYKKNPKQGLTLSKDALVAFRAYVVNDLNLGISGLSSDEIGVGDINENGSNPILREDGVTVIFGTPKSRGSGEQERSDGQIYFLNSKNTMENLMLYFNNNLLDGKNEVKEMNKNIKERKKEEQSN